MKLFPIYISACQTPKLRQAGNCFKSIAAFFKGKKNVIILSQQSFGRPMPLCPSGCQDENPFDIAENPGCQIGRGISSIDAHGCGPPLRTLIGHHPGTRF